jgi:hypothetical protein
MSFAVRKLFMMLKFISVGVPNGIKILRSIPSSSI